MQLTSDQMNAYEEHGFLLLAECFLPSEVARMKAELPVVFGEDSERRVLERDGRIVRSVYGAHLSNEIFKRLSLHPRLVEPARQILGGDVYIYQFKINAKVGFGGDIWEWHQDYIFWRNEDGMPAPRAVNATVFRDEVHEFNGPMQVIPGSHTEGVIELRGREGVPSEYSDSPEWISNLTADLKYSIDRSNVARLVRQHGIVAPKGQAGSVTFFHPNLVHGSASNTSPFDRAIAIVTYNSVENVATRVENRRPEFLVNWDPTPISPLSDVTFQDRPGGSNRIDS
jgi:ectoine hydroxylase